MTLPTNPFTPELWDIEAPSRIRKMLPAKIGDYCDSATFGNVTYIDEDNTPVIILGQYDAWRMIQARFAERLIDIPVKWDVDSKSWVLDVTDAGSTPPPTTVKGYISNLWTTYWINNNLKRYRSIYEVLNAEYKPLENYDKNSVITTDHGKVNTRTGSISSDGNIYGLNSPSGGADSEDRITTYNSLTDTNSGTDEVTEHISGNIGTVTAQDMMAQELDVRRFNLSQTMVEEWISLYTHY